MQVHQKEALLFSHYIVQEDPSAEVAARYEQFVRAYKASVSTNDQKILTTVLKRPWMLPFLDGALAVLRPSSELRRRIYIMLAILETTPQHANKFLPAKQSSLFLLPLAWSGIIAILQLIIGIILLKVVIR